MLRRKDWKIVLTLAFTFVLSLPGYWYQYFDHKGKSVSASVLSQVALQPVDKDFAQGVQVLIEGVPQLDPFLSVVQFTNDGEQPITVADFEAPLEIQLLPNAKLVRARVSEVLPVNLGAKITWDSRTAKVSPLLLNPKDKITISIITSGGQPHFTTVARIAGVSTIRLSDMTQRALGSLGKWKLLIAAILLSIAGAAVIDPIGSFVLRKPFKAFHGRMVELNLLITGFVATFFVAAYLDEIGQLSFASYLFLDSLIFAGASLLALAVNRMPLLDDGQSAIHNKEVVMMETFKVGDEVRELQGKQTMTVVSIEPSGNVMCAWAKNGRELKDTFAPDRLKKHTPQYGTMRVTGL